MEKSELYILIAVFLFLTISIGLDGRKNVE